MCCIQVYVYFQLINNAVGTQDYIVSNNWRIMNNEMGRMQKEAVVALFTVLSTHCRGETEENHESTSVGYHSNTS
jgi:hypothetical protein